MVRYYCDNNKMLMEKTIYYTFLGLTENSVPCSCIKRSNTFFFNHNLYCFHNSATEYHDEIPSPYFTPLVATKRNNLVQTRVFMDLLLAEVCVSVALASLWFRKV